MGVLGGLILKPTGEVAIRAIDFDANIYGLISNDAAYEVQNFEIETKLVINPNGIFQSLLAMGEVQTGPILRYGFIFDKTSGEQMRITINDGTIGATSFTHSQVLTAGTYNITAKKYGNTGEITIDGNTESGIVSAVVAYKGDDMSVGAFKQNTVYGSKYNAPVATVKYWSSTALGVRVNSLVDLDIANGDINTVPNVAINKPASSDMTFVPAGGGKYTTI